MAERGQADFGYGDSTVESVQVPCNGGGFVPLSLACIGTSHRQGRTQVHVVVKWSDEGGGRGGEHLVLLAGSARGAAPAAADQAQFESMPFAHMMVVLPMPSFAAWPIWDSC